VGRYAPDFSPLEDAHVTRGPVADVRAGRQPSVTVEKRFVRRDGEIRWAKLTISRLALGDGREGILGITLDVTERRHAQEALERERAFLSATLESLSDGVVACDAAGRLTLFNRASREVHGLSAEPLASDSWAAHYSLYRADGVTPLPPSEIPLLRAFGGEQVRDATMVVAPAGRPPRQIRASAEQIRSADGETLGAVVAMRDVTAQVAAEQALRESAARLDLIYNSASDLFFLMRVERDPGHGTVAYRCESVNEAYVRVTGLARDVLIGRTLPEILPPEAAAYTQSRYDEAVRSGGVQCFDEAVELSGGLLVVETTLTPVLDGAGECTHLLGVARDVTGTRRTEAALREREARFRGVLEHLRAPAVQLDASGRITSPTPRCSASPSGRTRRRSARTGSRTTCPTAASPARCSRRACGAASCRSTTRESC
jgi:PAS domain S-box-containing protein